MWLMDLLWASLIFDSLLPTFKSKSSMDLSEPQQNIKSKNGKRETKKKKNFGLEKTKDTKVPLRN